MLACIGHEAFRLEVPNSGLSIMAKLDRGFDPISFLRSVGGYGLLLLVITAGALIPIKAIELVSGRPVLDELVNFAKEPSIGVKTRSNNNPQ